MARVNETTREIIRLLRSAFDLADVEEQHRLWLRCIELDDGTDLDVLSADKKTPLRLRPYIKYIHVMFERDQVSDALGILDKALAHWPENALLQLVAGRCYSKVEDWTRAEAALRHSLELEPKAGTCLFLARSLDRLGRRDEARTILFRAIVIDPNDEESHYNIGYLRRREHDLDGAIESFRRAIELDADYALAHAELGSALLGRRPPSDADYESALEHLMRAVALNPNDGWSHAYLATTREYLGRYAESEANHLAATRLLPDIGVLWSNFGSFRSHRGEGREAERLLRHGVDLDSRSEWTRLALAKHLLKTRHRAEARMELMAAEQLGSVRAAQLLGRR